MATMSDPNPVSDSRSVPEQSLTHFANVDVGSPQLAGSATPVGRGWDLIAGGVDIWEKADQFHFVFQEISGDFDIAVRVESFTPAHSLAAPPAARSSDRRRGTLSGRFGGIGSWLFYEMDCTAAHREESSFVHCAVVGCELSVAGGDSSSLLPATRNSQPATFPNSPRTYGALSFASRSRRQA